MNGPVSTNIEVQKSTARKKNVGTQGFDLPTRVVACVTLFTLVIISAPPLGFSDSTLTIVALVIALLGAIFLMTSLFLSQKMYFAAITLIPTSLVMLLLTKDGLGWIASGIGILVLIAGLQNIATRRCWINRLLRVNSSDVA